VAVAIVSRVLRDRVERAREVVGRVEEAHSKGRDIAYDFAFATSRLLGEQAEESCPSSS
jgi:hypothetical protein